MSDLVKNLEAALAVAKNEAKPAIPQTPGELYEIIKAMPADVVKQVAAALAVDLSIFACEADSIVSEIEQVDIEPAHDNTFKVIPTQCYLEVKEHDLKFSVEQTDGIGLFECLNHIWY